MTGTLIDVDADKLNFLTKYVWGYTVILQMHAGHIDYLTPNCYLMPNWLRIWYQLTSFFTDI